METHTLPLRAGCESEEGGVGDSGHPPSPTGARLHPAVCKAAFPSRGDPSRQSESTGAGVQSRGSLYALLGGLARIPNHPQALLLEPQEGTA